jgi:hypothetical protein
VSGPSMLVTSDGHWVIEGSSGFFEALGDPEPDYDGTLFAVKNLGFIRFQVLDGSIVEIELHPRNVEPSALLAVQQQLFSLRCKLIRIKHFHTTWLSEITSSSEKAIARLSELCAPAIVPPMNERFVVESLNISNLFSDQDGPLRLMAQKWRASFGNFDPSLISFAVQHQLLSRMMIVGVKPHSGDPVFRFIGDGFRWLENDYQLYAIGQSIENQPDKDYGAWVSAFYRSVAETRQPRYDIVRAAIQTEGKDPTLFTTRYERLLLPWRTTSDEVLISLSSRRLPSGDIDRSSNDD